MKKIMSLLLAVLLVWNMTGCASGNGEGNQAGEAGTEGGTEPLVVAMELAYPPFEMRDEAGDPSGVSVDLIRAFGEYAGREIRIENTAWDGLIPALQTGAADIVISSMTVTEERKELIDFSKPYANALLAILANADSGITSIDDLNQEGKTIAVKSGSTGHMYAEKNLTKAEVLAMPDESACVTEVAQGRADGFIYDQLTIYRNWQNNPDTTAAIFIPFQEPEKWGIAVQKGNAGLLAQINAFLKEYKKEGGFDELTRVHLAEEKEAFDTLGFQWFFDMAD